MALQLTQLERLPGAADANLEALTRAIVSRRYGMLGALRERRNQPGVEFYLRVERHGELGDPGRVWGWSCKWFVLNNRNELSAKQREQIEDSLAKAIEHVKGLTDFVLCLPLRPAKKDEDWITGLGTTAGVTTSLWASENFDAQLAGHDELRSTFFGELALTPDILARNHERSVAPVKGRWVPLLHTSNHVEDHIDRALLRPKSFEALDAHVQTIAIRTAALRGALTDIDDEAARSAADAVAGDLEQFVKGLGAIVDAGRNHRPIEALERIVDQQLPATTPRALRSVVLSLRKQRLSSALAATGIGANIHDTVRWLAEARAHAQAPLMAVVAAAGQGKTHLAAQLTAPAGRPIAGVFIPGGRLRVGGSLDDLARRIPGIKVDRFEDLLEALNSAGIRAGSRVPLVIDGLNEAERPAEWRALLEELVPALGDYPSVAVIVTLREALAATAVPGATSKLELEWYEPEVREMVTAYFGHYLINASGAWLPLTMFQNPLFVRMYCEAANHDREAPVGMEALPTSLIGVFERYRDGAIQRLAADPAHKTVPADQIKRRLAAVALEMWTRDVRRLPSEQAQAILDAGETNWDESLFRRLEEEGVLIREEVDGGVDTETSFLFDRFVGYLIADALLTRMTYSEVNERLADVNLWTALLGKDGHPLGEDVAYGLAGLVPRRFTAHHLWKPAPEQHRSWALTRELDSESEFLDDSTVDELVTLIASWEWTSPGRRAYGRWHPFDRVWEVRASPAHLLNARFLDRVLRQLSLPERDRAWTEWTRHRTDEQLLDEVTWTIERWTRRLDRAESDDLDAQSLAWLLASTHRELRDLATKALQRYGRPEPKRLFDLAARMLDVDDPYIVERLAAAAFGAACAHQMPDPEGAFEQALSGWLAELRDRFLTDGSNPTSHALLRSYVQAVYEFAGTNHPSAVPDTVDPTSPAFATPATVPVMADDDPNAAECDRTFGMDFENYVIGHAIKGRGNYNFEHQGYRRARGEVMARVWELGWRAARLGDIDHEIAERSQPTSTRARFERYGKKYGWIGYYELVGRLADAENLPDWWAGAGRHVTPDIDPTFPENPPFLPIPLPEWAPAGQVDEKTWLRTGTVDVPADLWSPEELHDVAGGWLLVEGFLEHRRDGRKVFGFFRTILLDPTDLDPAVELAKEVDYPGNDFFPELPNIRDVFAGETPWSKRFEVKHDDDDDSDYRPRPALRRDWQDAGIRVGQLGVDLSPIDGPTALDQAYGVPSYEFADRFGLRQLPGTLDLVGLDGTRASAAFRVNEPWRGQLLFLRRDLVAEFAGDRRIVQVAWGEREVTVEWRAVPAWARSAHESYAHIWRSLRVLDERGSSEQIPGGTVP
jgi:hypothetical protein